MLAGGSSAVSGPRAVESEWRHCGLVGVMTLALKNAQTKPVPTAGTSAVTSLLAQQDRPCTSLASFSETEAVRSHPALPPPAVSVLNIPAPHPVLARSCFNSAPMHRYSCRRGRLRVAQTHPRSRRPPPGARRQLSRTRPICFRHSTPGARSCCRPPSQRTRSRTADGSLEPLLAIILRPSSSRCSSRCYHAALGGARRRLLSSAPF